jgi:hypothetical protein
MDGEVFTTEDMQAFARTITRGFGRLGEGVLYGTVVGTPRFGPDQVQVPGNYLRIIDHSSEAFNTIADFLLRYQKNPRNVDLSQLIRFRSATTSAAVSNWSLY